MIHSVCEGFDFLRLTLKLQLFVLHNTDTVSFPLSRSRFLRYNKQTYPVTVSVECMTVEITLLSPDPPRPPILTHGCTHVDRLSEPNTAR